MTLRLLALLVLLAGCARTAPAPPPPVPADVKKVTFEVVARDNRCEPSVLALDREGRGILVAFQVTSVGKSHQFLIPGLKLRRAVPAGTRVEIPVFVERSGIYEYACAGSRWIGPFTATGKLAIK